MPPSPRHTDQIVDHLFRHESGRIVSVLSRIIGINRLDLVEDSVQDALLKALKTWPFSGVPANPPAWIMQVARNRAIDRLRRERTELEKQDDVRSSQESEVAEVTEPVSADEIGDDQLRMMFACCHSSIPHESQTALILRTLCGFGTAEIARAFLTHQETVNKRLVRAKQHLRNTYAPDEITESGANSGRLQAVLSALYLLFNEGYNASSGPVHVRRELCDEAIRLTGILARHPAGDLPETHGLLALMLFHGARLGSRTDADGNLLQLKDQNRELWDASMIRSGFRSIERSGEGREITRYQIEAGIAACHCLAPTYAATDWKKILFLYDLLVRINDSPVVLLNRAVALSHVHGVEAGMEALATLRGIARLEQYYLLYAVLAEFQSTSGDHAAAAESYRKAMDLTTVTTEREFLSRRLTDVSANLEGH